MSEVKTEVRETKLDEQGEARRQVALAQIRQYPDPALRLPAREVTEFDDDLRRLVERMTTLLKDANGVGLAANQVGVLRRVFVFQPDENPPRALVNPRIVTPSEEVESGEEGCLSMQGVLVPVDRSARLTVEGNDVDGSSLKLELEGLAARVVQHEIDHLDGVLIIDRTNAESRREALGTLRPQPVLVLR